MKILLTGATGFIGNVLAKQLSKNCHQVVIPYRSLPIWYDQAIDFLHIPNIDGETDWGSELEEIDTVVHLAGKAHVLNETSSTSIEAFRKINTLGTLHLAECAAKAGVKRFIFLSSIGVNGNQTKQPFNESSATKPQEPYAISKLEAETGLKEISKKTGMEYVIVRPPLVYGTNCPGNFLELLKVISRRLPLPFKAINNQRSFIGVDNLADFLVQCIEKPIAGDKVFLIADETDISTPELIRTLADGMNQQCLLLPVPYKLLLIITRLIGKSSKLEKLCGNLQVDASYAYKTLAWKPPKSQQQGLKEVASWYKTLN